MHVGSGYTPGQSRSILSTSIEVFDLFKFNFFVSSPYQLLIQKIISWTLGSELMTKWQFVFPNGSLPALESLNT